MEHSEILARANEVANAALAEASAVYDKVSARQLALGETLDALGKYIAAAETRVARLPASDQVAGDTARAALGSDPAQVVNTILNAVEAARVERAKAVQDLGAMLAAQKALTVARNVMHPEAHAAHQRLIEAQAALRPVAYGARSDAQILDANPRELSSVEKARRTAIYARAGIAEPFSPPLKTGGAENTAARAQAAIDRDAASQGVVTF